MRKHMQNAPHNSERKNIVRNSYWISKKKNLQLMYDLGSKLPNKYLSNTI